MEKTLFPTMGLAGLLCTNSFWGKGVNCFEKFTLAVDKGGGIGEAGKLGTGAWSG